MDKEKMKALFELAGVKVLSFWELKNQYWPGDVNHFQIRKEFPWWLVLTPFGLIQVGWRKRVISIDWASTDVRTILTEDVVTKEETYVHAWGYFKAAEYLTTWKEVAETLQRAGKLEPKIDIPFS